MKYPDRSWFWPLLDAYRDRHGRTIEEIAIDWIRSTNVFVTEDDRQAAITAKRWQKAPRSGKGVEQIIELIRGMFAPEQSFTFLEFGTCYGTTIARVLSAFPNAHGIGVEVDPTRFDITQWLIERMTPQWDLQRRVTTYNASILDVPLSPASIDVVFMDTYHFYDEDLRIIHHLIWSGVLREKFLFIVDDPFHTGTRRAREHFTAEHHSRYGIVTSASRNLWWFVPREHHRQQVDRRTMLF